MDSKFPHQNFSLYHHAGPEYLCIILLVTVYHEVKVVHVSV